MALLDGCWRTRPDRARCAPPPPSRRSGSAAAAGRPASSARCRAPGCARRRRRRPLRSCRAGSDDGLAERAAIRKVSPRHRLVDHAGARRLSRIALVEEAAVEQPDLHRLEVAGRDDADVGERILGRRRLLPFDVERQRRRGADVVQRQRRHRGCGGHARRASQPLDDVLVEAHQALALRYFVVGSSTARRRGWPDRIPGSPAAAS